MPIRGGRPSAAHHAILPALLLVISPGFTHGPAVSPRATTPEHPMDLAVSVSLEGTIAVAHEEDFFNRRTVLTVRYYTGVGLEECSDSDLDNVVLTVVLPAGTSLVEASQGGAPMPPSSISGQTLTWSLGTLDRFEHCFGTGFDVTIEADASLADDASLQATASITTSTAGDDPADNQASATFPAVMFPLEVEVVEATTECLHESTMREQARDDGGATNCGIGRAVTGSTDPPGPLGIVPASGPRPYVRSRRLILNGGSYHDGLQSRARARTRIRIANPNPFEVPLYLHYDAVLDCRVRDGQAETRASTPIPLSELGPPFAECGYGNVARMSEHMVVHYVARGGPDGQCETRVGLLSDERDDDNVRETQSDCSLDRVGPSRILDFELEALGEERSGVFSATAAWCLATSASACSPCAFTCIGVSIVAESPVDLLVTDSEGRRVGAVDDPDLGTIDVVEIPGAGYSGAGTEPQTITLGLADPGDYALTVVGRGDGPYTITVTTEDDDGVVAEVGAMSGQASDGMTLERAVLLGTDGRAALEPELLLDDVVGQLLDATGPLDAAALDFLDLRGNANGGFDVGDFRAYLAATGAIGGG